MQKKFLRNKDNFRVAKNNIDGLTGSCKTCLAYYDKTQSKHYYERNKEKILEHNKAWNKKAYKENPERYKNYARKVYWSNPEEGREKIARWREENKERWLTTSRISTQKRKAKLAQLEHTLTLEEWIETLDFFEYSCAYCGVHQDDLDRSLEQDHIIPVSKGGGYTAGNIVPACKSCNASKNNQDLIEWYSSRDDEYGFTLELITMWKEGLY